MRIKPITNDEELAVAISEIDRLWPPSRAPAAGTPEADELTVLAILVDAYEREKVPDLPPDPIAAIEFWMEQKGLSRKDLERYIGSRSRVHEVLTRKRGLSMEMIRRLHYGLGIPVESLIGPPESGPHDAAVVDEHVPVAR